MDTDGKMMIFAADRKGELMTDTEEKRRKAICEAASVKEIDDVSDGFHTFRQLYYQRMMLFAAIVKQNKDKAWKSLRHEDGELCFGGGWFIVGIDTPEGSFTYHYEDNYFSLFDCKELECGKHWDGHTEKDVTRLLSLPYLPSAEPDVSNINDGDMISRQAAIDAIVNTVSEIGLHDNSEVARYGATFRQHEIIDIIKSVPFAQPEWNNHTVACLLADVFGDSCACNFSGIDEWLPEKCELLDSCPNPVGVACWEQFLKHREERRADNANVDT